MGSKKFTDKTDITKFNSDLKSNPEHSDSFSSVDDTTNQKGTFSKSLTATQKTLFIEPPDVPDNDHFKIPDGLE